jgi:hypothetical protein
MMAAEVDPKDLASTGWGIIVPEGFDPKIREALEPLIRLRGGQTARDVRILEYRPSEDSRTFLSRYGARLGPSDPNVLPFYLMIAGGPDVISYDFENLLGISYGVGRIDFSTPEEFAAYAESVVRAEVRTDPGPLRVTIFCADGLVDPSIEGAGAYLAFPVREKLRSRRYGLMSTIEIVTGGDATRDKLIDVLGTDRPPDLLMTIASGIGFPSGHPLQRKQQGSLLCYGTPGDSWFSTDEVPAEADLTGMIGVHVASFSAGTPRIDSLGVQILGEEKLNAPAAFVAGLPRQLLSNRGGGALGVIGYADRISVFGPPERRWERLQTLYSQCTQRLLRGHRAGYVIGQAKESWAAAAADLTEVLGNASSAQAPDDQVVDLWCWMNNVRALALIGDPAIRLGTRAPRVA